MSEENNAAAQDSQDERQFAIQKIYTKDMSFETPNSPQIFMETWEPEVNLNLASEAKALEQSKEVFEVVLSVTATVRTAGKVAFLVEVQTAGIFAVKSFPPAEMGPLLGSFFPSQLFPYAREAVSDLVTRGGFQALILPPVNFDQLYAEQQKQKAQQQAEQVAAASVKAVQ